MSLDEQFYLAKIARLNEQITDLQTKLHEWENSELRSDISTHIYMNGNPVYQVDGKVQAARSSYVQVNSASVLQKSMIDGYGWSFGDNHLSYTVDNRLNLQLVNSSGQILKSTVTNHRPVFGDLSIYQINNYNENDFLPIYYDNNTGQYKCIKASNSSYTYTTDSSILHPFFRPT